MNYETTVETQTREEVPPEVLGLEDDQRRARSRRRLIIAAVALVVLLAVLYYAFSGGDAGDTGVTKDQSPVVSVISPGRGTVQGTINATGTLAARRAMPIGVVGEGGRVVSVPVEAGQWVRAGQILAVIDRSVQIQQAESAEANIQVAKADAELAQANLDRALKLVARGFISKADIDRLTATRDAAVARVRVAEAQYGERRARNAQLNIVAPAAGLLLERKVEPGQVVSPGTGELFSIAKDGEMELLAEVGETELAKLAVGVTAEVTPVGTGKAFTGQVWQIAPVIDEQDRQGTARIALAYAPELRPGGFASAVIKSGTVVAPILPESAILNDEEGSYVYIVGKDNKVERRAVKSGIVTERGITVIEGLDGTEKVVMRAGGFLSPGEVVRPRLTKGE
ncbi:MAG TPA: efflux RND transporter periplasmic adaptor subunit [Croceibacterium sp.]|nr:efflux RND transporter periplasmic adaptor subunit [Croceibacterium sp.]